MIYSPIMHCENLCKSENPSRILDEVREMSIAVHSTLKRIKKHKCFRTYARPKYCLEHYVQFNTHIYIYTI